jgi:uncharacterized protein
VMRNHIGTVVGSGTTPPVMITDDHKTNNKAAVSTDAELESQGLRQVSQRGQNSNAQLPRKRKSKPYDGARPLNCRSSPSQSKESTPFSQGLPTTPGTELSAYNPIETPLCRATPLLPKHEDTVLIAEFADFNHLQSPVTRSPPEVALHNEDGSAIPIPFFVMSSEGITTSTPKIQRLIPSAGPIHGGIEITILGSGFRPDIQLSVLFGGQPATFTQRWSDNALVCLLPAAPVAGVVPVTFEGYEGVQSQTSLFTYVDENERAL